VLLDMTMPEVDGWAVLEQLRREPVLGRAPVLLMAEGGANTERATSLGANGVVEKPLDAGRLLETIRNCLGRRS